MKINFGAWHILAGNRCSSSQAYVHQRCQPSASFGIGWTLEGCGPRTIQHTAAETGDLLDSNLGELVRRI